MTNISLVMLPGGRWQIWDGPNAINGKSDVANYDERIVWLRPDDDIVYIAQTAYYGEARVWRAVRPRGWTFDEIDQSI